MKVLIAVCAVLMIAFSTQSVHAFTFVAHNSNIPIPWLKVKYQFFNESTHYRAFFNRIVNPLTGGVLLLNPPEGTFQEGDRVHSCVTEITDNPSAQCSNTITIYGNSQVFEYDLHMRHCGFQCDG